MALGAWLRRWRERRVVSPAVRFSKRGVDWPVVLGALLPPPLVGEPRITIVTPLWNTKPQWLAEAAVSVFEQSCLDWEWCLVDDGSTLCDFRRVLPVSPRVRWERLERNSGISEASNAGLQMARGEFVCFLDHDDLLDAKALELCLTAVQGFDAVYTDSNKADERGVCDEPFHKPDWSPDYFRSVMYVGHLLCVRRDLALASGGFDSRFDGVQDFEFFLRYSERYRRVAHLPRLLYTWRRVAGSVAASLDAKPNITRLQSKAVAAQLERLRLPAVAVEGPGAHRVTVVPSPRSHWPRVSIHTGSTAAELNRSVVRDGGEFLAFRQSQPVVEDWVARLLYYAAQPDIAVAGASAVDFAREGQVSADCLVIRRAIFEEFDGFNEHYFTSCFAEDLCFRLQAAGKRTIAVPGIAECSNTPPDPIDRNLLLDEWDYA